MNFKSLSGKSLNLDLGLNQLQQKGALVYEYNPLRVLRTNEDIRENGVIVYPKGSLINLDTELLSFDLNHPLTLFLNSLMMVQLTLSLMMEVHILS